MKMILVVLVVLVVFAPAAVVAGMATALWSAHPHHSCNTYASCGRLGDPLNTLAMILYLVATVFIVAVLAIVLGRR
jgi:hypothetical protein